MKVLEKGSKFKNWVIRTVVAQSMYRAEYILEPEKDQPGSELRAIVYDVPATPESMLWHAPHSSGAVSEGRTPYELKFLRENNSAYFPKVVQHGGSSSCHWVVATTPAGMRLDEYLRKNPPLNVRESLELVIKICLALEEIRKFHDARYSNITRSSIFVTPKGQVFLVDLQYNGPLCLDRVKPLLSQSLLGAEPSR